MCGGSSLLTNFLEYTQEVTGKPTEYLQCIHHGKALREKVGDKETTMVQSISLAMQAGLRGVSYCHLSHLNLRKGEFALVKNLEGLKDNIKFYGAWAAVLMLVLIAQFSVRYWNVSRDADVLQEQIVKGIEDILPDIPKGRIKNGKQALNVIKGRIGEYRDKVNLLTSGLKNVTALDVLKEISRRIQPSIVVDVREMSINMNKIYIKGDTSSFSSVDKIVEALRDYEHFSKVEKGAIADAPDGKSKRFSINIVVGEESKE